MKSNLGIKDIFVLNYMHLLNHKLKQKTLWS